jgi:predicted transcriptional regulator
MNLSTTVKLRVPADLRAHIDQTAARSARNRSDVTREAIALGLQQLSRRMAGNENAPSQAA